jgi:hypothetical protein
MGVIFLVLLLTLILGGLGFALGRGLAEGTRGWYRW